VKAGGDLLIEPCPGKHVAGQLLDCELVERQIEIERLDDPVAIFPDRPAAVDRVAVGVRVSGHVEPVPSPALAVVRRRQQPIDELFVRVAAHIGQKSIDVLDRRRQSEDVEARAAQERSLVGFRRRLQAGRLNPRQHKGVDSVSHPGRIPDRRRFHVRQRLKRPMVAPAPTLRHRLRVGRQLRSFVDPALHQRDFGLRERRALGRHLRHFLVAARDGFDDAALGTLAGHQRRTAVPSL
jgi:hypothetical protein